MIPSLASKPGRDYLPPMRRLVLTLLALLFLVDAARCEEIALDFPLGRHKTYFEFYDVALPALVSALVVKPEMNLGERIDAAVSYVNFFATPNRFEKLPGLGSGAPWHQGASLMLKSGNMLCSEQSSLAALLLEPHHPAYAIRDVAAHTFHEVFAEGKWRIVDPMFDVRLKAASGEPIAFEDVQAFLAGNRDAIRLPNPHLPRMDRWTGLFKREAYVRVRHDFGENIPLNKDRFYGPALPSDPAKVAEKLKAANIDVAQKASPLYPLLIRNALYQTVAKSPDPAGTAAAIQDRFFTLIESERGYLDGVDELWFARNLLVLGRAKEALTRLDGLEKSELALFSKAQAYAILGDRAKFAALAPELSENIFYAYLHWQLTGKALLPGDPERFKGFDFKLYTDGPTPKPPFSRN